MSGRRIAKRACDGCKIRKIRCSQIAPCEGCTQAGIACTFVKQPGARGPRRPRRSTLDEIQRTQQEWQDLASTPPDEPVSHTRLDAESVFAPSKVAALVLQLCVYRLRMYPVWPIIKVERLVASLQKPQPDIEVFALAYAVAAATIAQIRSTPSAQHGGVTAEMMEAQCQFAKVRRDKGQLPDLTTVRIPFFLHMYYENIEPGGLTSITYLREAITIAHMVGLHRESYYSQVDPMEREIRRRTFWLLYVAERRIAVQYKLPVLLNTHISFPSTDDSDEHEVLLGFQKIVQLYWQLDQVGLFRSLDFHSFELANCAAQTAHIESMPQLLHSLRSTPLDTEEVNEIQAVDLQATTYWAQFLLTWLSQGGLQASNDLCFLAKAFLTCLNDRSEDSVEAYRPSLVCNPLGWRCVADVMFRKCRSSSLRRF